MKNIILLLVVLLFTISCHRKVPYTRSTSFVSTKDSTYIGYWVNDYEVSHHSASPYFGLYLFSKNNVIYCIWFDNHYREEVNRTDKEIQYDAYTRIDHILKGKDSITIGGNFGITGVFQYLNDSTVYYYQYYVGPTRYEEGLALQIGNNDELNILRINFDTKGEYYFKDEEDFLEKLHSKTIRIDSSAYEIYRNLFRIR